MGNKGSGCMHFIKFKNDNLSSGLCEIRDVRCNSDCSCDLWEGIKYNRKHIKELTELIIKENTFDHNINGESND